ncbi:Uncharacterized protein G9444_0791 [Rhodococcus erythropolis]|uniref:Uncharacterized protein n=1 Tax=Rhodococcus erythropolis TaxID=1833 RepID=A0A6G9CLX9_RHOER|nr:hypothetical protein [Rhodococcus erythropolis]QIP38035.1 Uncharacterized protein G9444_0791 [Rhodococcus erythropolis]
MSAPVLSRVQLFAAPAEAEQIARLITAIIQAEPTVRPMTRVDGVETLRYDFSSNGIRLEVMADERTRVPSLLQFDTADLDGALERVLAAGFPARTWPPEGQVEDVVVEIGDLTVCIARREKR